MRKANREKRTRVPKIKASVKPDAESAAIGRGMRKERLQKVLAAAGVDSRRNCEQLILDGSITVNERIIDTLPAFVDPEHDVIEVNGRRIHKARKVYFILNKPKNVICTSRDPYGRKKAVDLINCPERIFCVGRLDTDTTGAILLTNDAELANRLTHPRYEIDKTYQVKVRGFIEGEAIENLKKGVWLSEGKTEKSIIKVLKRNNLESQVQIIIHQSLNRQVRRIMAKVGYKVKSMHRTKIGPIGIEGLGLGQYRPLSAGQLAALKKSAGL